MATINIYQSPNSTVITSLHLTISASEVAPATTAHTPAISFSFLGVQSDPMQQQVQVQAPTPAASAALTNSVTAVANATLAGAHRLMVLICVCSLWLYSALAHLTPLPQHTAILLHSRIRCATAT
jgi:hypothetical protein